MASRLAFLESHDGCVQQTIREHLGNWNRSCAYIVGERFLLVMYPILEREGFSSALKELIRTPDDPVNLTEEAIYDAFLRHVPAGREEDFRSAYRRLYG